MYEHFFEIVLVNKDYMLEDRDDLESPLQEALDDAGLGEITAAGSGMGLTDVVVEATEFEPTLVLIRRVLGELKIAPSTKINYHRESDGKKERFKLYE